MASGFMKKIYPANHKTIFVLDHTPYFGISSDYMIELDPPDKPRGPGFIPIAPISKSIWTHSLEAVMEYCRIVWDLFHDQKLIRLVVSDSKAQFLNTWNNEEQNVLSLINMLHTLRPVPHGRANSGDHSVIFGLRSAIEAQCEITFLQGEKLEKLKQESATKQTADSPSTSAAGGIGNKLLNRCRVVCLTSCIDKESLDKLKEIFQADLIRMNKIADGSDRLLPIYYCHLVIINIFPNNMKLIQKLYELQHPDTYYSPTLSTEVHVVKAGWELANKLSHLIQEHYDLSSTTVTGIPMKEEQNANSSANYDVEIFHPSDVHDSLLKGNIADLSTVKTKKESSTYDTITLRWSTPRNTVTEMQNCTSVHRITPVDVNSRPSSCLINFLLNGRSVNLEMIKRVGGKVISHMLTSHGGDIYMHALATGRSILEDPPSISEGYGGKVTDYRIAEFAQFVKANKLLPAKNCGPNDKFNEKMKKRLESQTQYWPLTISSTLIFNNKPVFEPLLTLVQSEELTDSALIQCNQCVYNLVALESKHEPLIPNSPSTRGKGPKRDEQYRQLWNELEHYVKVYSRSDNHTKLLQTVLDFKNKSPSNIADDKHVKVELNQALRELDIIKDMASTSTSTSAFERASVIRTFDSPMSPPTTSIKSNHGHKRRSLLDIYTARTKHVLNKTKRPDFHGLLTAEPGPNGTSVSKLYIDLQIKDEEKKEAKPMQVE